MAEEEDEAQEEQPARPALRPAQQPSLLRYLPVVLLVLLLQAGGAYFLIDRYLFGADDGRVAVEDETGRPRTMPTEDDRRASVDLDEIMTNARGEDAKLLIRTTVTLVVAPRAAKDEIESELNQGRVRDAVIWALGNATPKQLNNAEGRVEVKEQVKERVNEYLYEGQVVEVYFGTFILQAMSGYEGD